MSRETISHLNTQTLIGNTDVRGNAWHYRADEQGSESNHYPLHIPAADVERRLFSWKATSAPLQVLVPASFEDATTVDANGAPVKALAVPGKQAIVRSDTDAVLGIFGESSYKIHQFNDWLVGTVSNILGDTVGISSAGLLKGGAVAWVEVSIPETLSTNTGVTYRPNLLACTSHDGSLATTFKRTVTNTVCDNTMGMALSERGQTFKVKHSVNSLSRLSDARQALGIIEQVADDFAAEVDALVATSVTDRQWFAFLDALVPVDLDASGRSKTMTANKRDGLTTMWRKDERVAPWSNTAWGVVQAVNTYVHHEGIVRGADRAERNMLRAVTGGADTLDQNTLQVLGKVLAKA